MSGLPKIGVAFSFPIPGLVSQADTKLLITNPTIVAGDFKIWNPAGGGSYDNLATTPTVLGAGVSVLISLSATEMGAAYIVGNGITVNWQDAAGGQWCSGGCTIFPSTRNLEDLAFPTTSGNSIDVLATGEVGIDWGNIANQNNTAALSDTTIKTATNVETDTADIQARLPAALVGGKIDANVGSMDAGGAADFFTVNSGQTGAGAVAGSVVHEIGHAVLAIGTVFPAGAIQFTYTVTNSVTGLPIEGVEVWFSTDLGAANIVWKGDTDAFGIARDVLGNLPALDVGIYYVWRQRSGYTFADPDTEDVS